MEEPNWTAGLYAVMIALSVLIIVGLYLVQVGHNRIDRRIDALRNDQREYARIRLEVLRILQQYYSDHEKYELAAKCRDSILELENLLNPES